MRPRLLVPGVLVLGLAAPYAAAQRPDADAFVERMLAFDKDKDGRLTKAEVTDDRLSRLFDRADADRDGVVTRQELSALAAREAAADRGRGGGPGFGPPPGGPGFAPGQILPPPLQQRLGLTADQRSRVEALQKEVDGKLDGILNAEQRAQLKQLRERGPRGPGRPPGGPPPRDVPR